ncbi:hypothetical protein K1719_043171 [Acacia pycnantha]|nr:hypothetical protein K1719_043171 [Acacia pycnantha]
MLCRFLNLLDHSVLGRIVGSLSCVVGLLCYALSSSFKSLFGEWNPTKIVLYIILISIISVVVLFEAKSRVSFVSKLKPHVQFLVLMLTSLYSFFADRYKKGRPDTWSVISSVAFALASLCLSQQIKPGFDVGLFGFFLGRVTVQLMEIHLIFILVASGFSYPLVVLKSYSESQSDHGDSRADQLEGIPIDGDDDANRAAFGMDQVEEAGQISPRRRVRDVPPSPSPSPRPSTLLTQDDDRRASSRSGKGGSSSSSDDPLVARLPAHGNKSFEKLPEVAATEQFLSDLQEREKQQQQQQQEQWEQPVHQERPQQKLRERLQRQLQLQRERRSCSGI